MTLLPALSPGGLTAWRREQRASLLAARQAVPPAQHAAWSAQVLERLRGMPELNGTVAIGAYWAMRGEVDLLPLLTHLAAVGTVALPRILGRGRPLEFRTWRPGAALERGPYSVLHPVDGRAVQPQLLLVPVLGFDRDGYRLGYGGGYYDRTLEPRAGRPRTVGVGFSIGQLATIHPQPFDVPLDLIVTEQGVLRCVHAEAGDAARA